MPSMSKRCGVLGVAAILFLTIGLGAQETVDREMVERIKAEGNQRSQVASCSTTSQTLSAVV